MFDDSDVVGKQSVYHELAQIYKSIEKFHKNLR